jgi:hypothetical protein
MSCIADVRDAWVSVSWSFVMRRSSVRFRQAAHHRRLSRKLGLTSGNAVMSVFLPTDLCAPGVTRGYAGGTQDSGGAPPVVACIACGVTLRLWLQAFASESAHRGEKVGACVGARARDLSPVMCQATVLNSVGAGGAGTASMAVDRRGS